MMILLMLSFLAINSSVAFAQENQCIGNGDPKNNFYIQRLASREQRSKQVPQEILNLETRNHQIAQTIDLHRQQTLPNLKKAIANQNARLEALKQEQLHWSQKSHLEWKQKQLSNLHQWKEERLRQVKQNDLYKTNPQQAAASYQQEVKERERAEIQKELQNKKKLAAEVNRKLNIASLGNKTREDQIRRIEGEIVALEAELQGNVDKLTELKTELSDIEFIVQWRNSKNQSLKNSEGAFDCSNCVPSTFLSNFLGFMQTTLTLPVPKLDKACILNSIRNKTASASEIACEGNERKPIVIKNSCINEDIADYVHWSINKALDCLSDPSDPIDPNFVYMKVNNESTFRPFYSYSGGKGLMQVVTCAKDEMLGLSPSMYCDPSNSLSGTRSAGRKFLAKQLAQNSKTRPHCQMYKSIFNYELEARYDELKADTSGEQKDALKQIEKNYPQITGRTFSVSKNAGCEDVSLSEGVHRNLLAGLGLYLFYRDIGKDSASGLVQSVLKIDPSNPEYKKIRDYLALGMYGPDGAGGMKSKFMANLPSMRAKMKSGNLRFEDFKGIMLGMRGRNYYKEVDRSLVQVYGDQAGEVQCSIL